MDIDDLDPNYEWIETTCLGIEGRTFVKGRCKHIAVAPELNDKNKLVLICCNCNQEVIK